MQLPSAQMISIPIKAIESSQSRTEFDSLNGNESHTVMSCGTGTQITYSV